MCGICGVVQVGTGVRREVVSPDVLDRMTDVMSHRGPNDRGIYTAPGVAFGVRRLSIVDVDGGHQPISDDTGRVWGMQNGELYNFTDLRKELCRTGSVFRTRCDTEVIPHVYRRDGELFPRALRGKFAAAVWDERERRAVVARDRLGVKPLYYARSDDLLVFASELKAVLTSGLVSPELDLEAIDAYLSLGFVPGPRTPVAGVRKLMPGHLLVADDAGVRIERYWQYPHPAPAVERRAPNEWSEELLERLDEAVRLRLMSDVPLGAMLSGGIDSSLVVGLMARHMSEPVRTFSVGFRESAEGNELDDARYVARVFGTEHHELELSFVDDTVDLATLVWFMDEPLADLSALGFLALSELASRHVTVALSGQGADELLGGYRKHRAASVLRYLQPVRAPAASVGRAFARWSPTLARSSAALSATTSTERMLAMSGRLQDGDRGRLVREHVDVMDGRAARRAVEALAAGLSGDPLSETLYLDAQLALVDDMLHYFDRASMAHSLEVRVPFLDHELVEFCATIPSGLKVRRLDTKHVLKQAARAVVPDRIVDKPKIGFFRGAVGAWFKAQAGRAIDDYLLAPEPRYAEFLERREVERLIARHRETGDPDLGHLLLALLMLEVWLSTYLPRFADSRTAAAVA
ncbi:MAG TPA: asparagine synthase (glutamine-hydrolyzing) [Gaiellaceae bacterium]